MRRRLGREMRYAGLLGERLDFGRWGDVHFRRECCSAALIGPQRRSPIAGSQVQLDQAAVRMFVPGIVRDPACGGFDSTGDLTTA